MFQAWWNSDIGFILTVVFHGLLISVSIILTIHILLYKSDPKASLMWIALVWLAPIFGTIFYFLFGINRISRRASRIGKNRKKYVQAISEYKYRNSDSPSGFGVEFHRLGDWVTQSDRVHENKIDVLEGVEFIHLQMELAIAAAEKSIALSTYIFKNDDLGKGVAEALLDANERGVDVKVLLDGVGAGLFRFRMRRRLQSGGIEVQRFLHGFWPWKIPLMNLRNHRKILIVDGHTAFTGSLNIGRVNNLETHFQIEGPLVKQLIETFESDWVFAGGDKLSGQFVPSSKVGSGMVTMRGVRSGPIYERERLRWIILGAMGCAKKDIRIVTPYFIPDRGLLSGLVLAALRGVQVEIFLPKKSNYPFVDWASHRQIGELTRAGCHIYHRSDVFDHSKLMTVDGQWALIGSSNWDARSLRLNFEFDVECEGLEFVSELNRVITLRRNNSELLSLETLEARPVSKVLRDSAARLLQPYL